MSDKAGTVIKEVLSKHVSDFLTNSRIRLRVIMIYYSHIFHIFHIVILLLIAPWTVINLNTSILIERLRDIVLKIIIMINHNHHH